MHGCCESDEVCPACTLKAWLAGSYGGPMYSPCSVAFAAQLSPFALQGQIAVRTQGCLLSQTIDYLLPAIMYSTRHDPSKKFNTCAPSTLDRPGYNVLFNYNELRHEGPAYCGRIMLNLPGHSTLTFADQTIDPTSTEYRLSLGKVRDGGGTVPVWAYLTTDGRINFRFDAHNLVPLDHYHHFELIEPFCYLSPSPSNSGQSEMEAVILWYFVVAKKWSPSPNNKQIYVSLPALKRACEQIGASKTIKSEVLSDGEMVKEAPPVKSEFKGMNSQGHIYPQKRKREGHDADEPASKRAATALDKKQQLKAKQPLLDEYQREIQKALDMVKTHSMFAFSELSRKNNPEVALDVANEAVDADIELFKDLVNVFRSRYDSYFPSHLEGRRSGSRDLYW